MHVHCIECPRDEEMKIPAFFDIQVRLRTLLPDPRSCEQWIKTQKDTLAYATVIHPISDSLEIQRSAQWQV